MKWFIIGLLTFPAIWVVSQVLRIAYRTLRDTYRSVSYLELKDGYSRWCLVYALPLQVILDFWDCLKQQCWSWWHGIETEVR